MTDEFEEFERDILIFGYDEDEDDMVFEQTTIGLEVKDLEAYLQEVLKVFPKKHKGGCLINDGSYFDECDEWISIFVDNDSIDAGERHTDEEDARQFMVLEECGGWIYNFRSRTAEQVFFPTWNNRTKAKDSTEAMNYIATHLAMHFSSIEEDDLSEIDTYAKEHGIPFSAELISFFQVAFDTHQPQWNSSSAFC